MNKKGLQLKDLMPIGMMVLISVIAVSVGTEVTSNIFNDQCTYGGNGVQCYNSSGGTGNTLGDTYASNVSQGGMIGLSELGSWYPTIALVIAASVVIGVLVYSFATKM